MVYEILGALTPFCPWTLKPWKRSSLTPSDLWNLEMSSPLKVSDNTGDILYPLKTACPTDRICHTTLDTHSGHAPWESVPLEATLTDFREETKIFRRYFGLVPRT